MTEDSALWEARLKRKLELLRLLSGSGIEIGALHQPILAPHLDIKRVDRLQEEELRQHYGELKDQPLASVDIVDDGQTLATIADDSQDFVIANNLIEHMVSPIEAMQNWQRVLKPGGRLLLVVPDKEQTFDKRRRLTSIEHLVADFEDPSDERDKEHFHDYALEASARELKDIREDQADEMAEHFWKMQYSIHYHVWDQRSFRVFLDYLPSYFADWRMVVIDSEPTMGSEFAYVLEKQ